VAIDPDARIELHILLKELLAERVLASSDSVAADTAYMADAWDRQDLPNLFPYIAADYFGYWAPLPVSRTGSRWLAS
jgi:hypothetical protein